MTDRTRAAALRSLIEAQDAGGFTLPPAVEAADKVHRTAAALTVPDAPPLQHPDDAAVQLADALTAGDGVDPLALARQTARNRAEARDVDDARRLVRAATEVAATRAVSVATAHAEVLITGHLRPAFTDLLDQARDVASKLSGYVLTETRALVTAPASVRKAVTAAHELAERHQALRSALGWVNQVAELKPEHDVMGMFVVCEQPQALWPGWTPAERPRTIPAPDDPASRLLWLVGPGAVAKPWLPTIAERDARWWATYGEGVERMRGGHRDAVAVRTRVG